MNDSPQEAAEPGEHPADARRRIQAPCAAWPDLCRHAGGAGHPPTAAVRHAGAAIKPFRVDLDLDTREDVEGPLTAIGDG